METSCTFCRERGHGFGKKVAAIGAPNATYKLLATFLPLKIPFGVMDLEKLGF